MKKTLQALEDAGVTDKHDIYLACIIESNWEIFREVMSMIPELKERFLATAEEDGWLKDRDSRMVKERDIEIARGFKRDNMPFSVIVKNTGLTLQEVEAL